MYSADFRNWLFKYLESSSVEGLAGAEKVPMLNKLLDQCNYCENEATLTQLQIICMYYDKFGVARTRAYLSKSEAINKSDLDPQTGSKAVSRGSTNICEPPPPVDYIVVADNDPDKFQQGVNSYLQEGMWHLAGGVSVAVKQSSKTGQVLWSQALCRFY